MRDLNNKNKQKYRIKIGLRKLFEMLQGLGINVLPVHFYSEIPNIRELKKDPYWNKPYSMAGVKGADIVKQLDFVRDCCSEDLVNRQKLNDINEYARNKNGEEGYGPIEADFLYCFIRSKQPKKIIQIGCGFSTAVILLAAEESGYSPQVVCVDPYPNSYLTQLSREKQIKLIPQKAQLVDMGTLTDLNDNDLLFVDSTHTVKTGSEVNKIILEVLPRLRKGSWVHFHDIHLPFDYPRRILTTELFFSNETVLLYSFLINNYRYGLKVALSMLHYSAPERLKDYLPNYFPAGNDFGLEISKGHFPSSVFLEVIE